MADYRHFQLSAGSARSVLWGARKLYYDGSRVGGSRKSHKRYFSHSLEIYLIRSTISIGQFDGLFSSHLQFLQISFTKWSLHSLRNWFGLIGMNLVVSTLTGFYFLSHNCVVGIYHENHDREVVSGEVRTPQTYSWRCMRKPGISRNYNVG